VRRLSAVALAALALVACSKPAAPRPRAAVVPGAVVFAGMCDASAAVALGDRLFVVADDEDNVLRVYDARRGGAPLSAVDVSSELALPLRGKKHPHAPEADLEAATRLGDHAYWITSHGRDKNGERRPERLRFFATNVPAGHDALEIVGRPYGGLLDDLLAAASLAPYGLAAAAELPPKAPGGFNIEGLTATVDGHLLLGFRNPVPEGRALLVPLENPDELVASESAHARFGAPVLLDVGGQGVRALALWRGRYLVVAGSSAEGGESYLYMWDGVGAATRVDGVDLAGLNPEAIIAPEDLGPDGEGEILLLSDDGTRTIDGVACKDLDGPARKRFRGLWVRGRW
jgi:hypothetical protein